MARRLKRRRDGGIEVARLGGRNVIYDPDTGLIRMDSAPKEKGGSKTTVVFYREIQVDRGLNPSVVRTHLTDLFRKYGITDVLDAAELSQKMAEFDRELQRSLGSNRDFEDPDTTPTGDSFEDIL